MPASARMLRARAIGGDQEPRLIMTVPSTASRRSRPLTVAARLRRRRREHAVRRRLGSSPWPPAPRRDAGSRSCERTVRPGSTSPAKVRKTGRTASLSRLSVTTMSRIGCACPATLLPDAERLEQPPRRRNDRRGALIVGMACAERGIRNRHGKRRPQRLPQGNRERQPGKAAAGYQHVGIVTRHRLFQRLFQLTVIDRA